MPLRGGGVTLSRTLERKWQSRGGVKNPRTKITLESQERYFRVGKGKNGKQQKEKKVEKDGSSGQCGFRSV